MHPMSPGLLVGRIRFLIDEEKDRWPSWGLREALSNLNPLGVACSIERPDPHDPAVTQLLFCKPGSILFQSLALLRLGGFEHLARSTHTVQKLGLSALAQLDHLLWRANG